MTDIVERLRAENSVRLACGLDLSDVLLDAANEIERLRREVLSVEPTPIWVHQKRGTAYRELGRATLQAATGPAAEGDTLVIYRGDDGRLWAREVHEFEDGRFALVAAREAAARRERDEARAALLEARREGFLAALEMAERRCEDAARYVRLRARSGEDHTVASTYEQAGAMVRALPVPEVFRVPTGLEYRGG